MSRLRFILSGSLLAAALFGWPFATSANPYFAQQTGQPCSTCHLPGQEVAGQAGLNPTGQSFKACGEQPSCLHAQYQQPYSQQPYQPYPQQPYQPYPQPSYQQPYQQYSQPFYQQPSTAVGGGFATFKNDCGFGTRYIAIRMGNGTTANYSIQPFGHIRISVLPNSTFAASCGNPPGFNANYRVIVLDP
jgi:hypothetical protein